MRPDDELALEDATRLGRIARTLDGAISPSGEAASRARFLAALERPRRPRRQWIIAASGFAVALAAALFIQFRREPSPLQYSVWGADSAAGWLDVAADQPAGFVRFSEGTEIELAPGSQSRVAELTKHGAHVVLRSGRLHARVVHRPQTRWLVGAGPYAIDVTGTSFEVDWSENGGELVVRLIDGSVIVRGPALHEGIRVAAGQRLVAHAATGNAELSTLSSARTARPGSLPPPLAVASPPPTRRDAGHVAPSWTELLTDGNFSAVVAQARSRGLETTLRRVALADLVALSDAARYSGDRALARRGLLAQRARFAAAPEAQAAAFLLGRLADDASASDEALHWYDVYLRESPRGVFAAEALGRKLVVVVGGSDEPGARALAKQYLHRFADGAHAAYAREVLARR